MARGRWQPALSRGRSAGFLQLDALRPTVLIRTSKALLLSFISVYGLSWSPQFRMARRRLAVVTKPLLESLFFFGKLKPYVHRRLCYPGII
jgi:hypothetical protein